MYDRLQESIELFELFFGWHLDANVQSCQNNELQREAHAHFNKYAKDAGNSNEVHPDLTTEALERILFKNKIDLLLYDYSRFLFDYQGRVLFDTKRKTPK